MDVLQMVPETPAIVIDKQIARRNAEALAAEFNKYGCAYRPHSKTHKMVEFSKLQMESGAIGICCAKISEAEAMAEGGIRDIFVAYPVVGEFRIRRVARLAEKIRLILTVDSREGAEELSRVALEEGVVFEVRMEIDTQFRRTGVKREHAVELAKYISALPNLKLTGISTFRSLTYNGESTHDAKLAGEQEGEMLVSTAEAIRAAGIPVAEVSGGSTPTGKYVASVKGVTEVRPGTNLFNDYGTYAESACEIKDIAAYLVFTVVSAPEPGYAVIDGGSKAIATDFPLQGNDGKPEYAFGKDDASLVVNRIYEEHGIVVRRNGNTGLKVGDRIAVYPAHICSTINLYNHVYVLDNNELRKVKVDARGMLA